MKKNNNNELHYKSHKKTVLKVRHFKKKYRLFCRKAFYLDVIDLSTQIMLQLF